MSDSAATFLPAALQQAAEEVAALLRERKETISVAETAAGGLISAALLATPGASAFYKGGLTVSLSTPPAVLACLALVCLLTTVVRQLYSLQSRIEFAGWTPAHLDNYHGPTPEIVAGLAENVRAKLKSTYTVSEVSVVPNTY